MRTRRLITLVKLAVTALPAAIGCGSSFDYPAPSVRLADASVTALPDAAAPTPSKPDAGAAPRAEDAASPSAIDAPDASASAPEDASAPTTTPAPSTPEDAGSPYDGAIVAPSDPALPAVAPVRPLYEVPVTRADLKPYASFEVGSVDWRVDDDEVRLEYAFPAALSGRTDQEVDLRGPLIAPGRARLSGDAGSAVCIFSDLVVRCDEMLTGLELDPEQAQRMLSTRPAIEQELRGQVIKSFSGDPIGVLSFAVDPREREDED